MRNNIDISLFSKTKLEKHFQVNNLKSVVTKCLEEIDGGIMFYINENIPCKIVNVEDLPDDCAVTLVELSIKS